MNSRKDIKICFFFMIKHLNKIYNGSPLKKLLKNLNPTFLLLLIAKGKGGDKGHWEG